MSDKEWQPPKHIKPWMVCAANRHEETNHTILGARHWDRLMRKAHGDSMCRPPTGEYVQGFIDQWGRFYTREEAMRAVKKSGQPFNAERNGDGDELFSEGLY